MQQAPRPPPLPPHWFQILLSLADRDLHGLGIMNDVLERLESLPGVTAVGALGGLFSELRKPQEVRLLLRSHLTMRGGAHRDLATTQRDMHLSPAAVQSAIRLLEPPQITPALRDIPETGDAAIGKATG